MSLDSIFKFLFHAGAFLGLLCSPVHPLVLHSLPYLAHQLSNEDVCVGDDYLFDCQSCERLSFSLLSSV